MAGRLRDLSCRLSGLVTNACWQSMCSCEVGALFSREGVCRPCYRICDIRSANCARARDLRDGGDFADAGDWGDDGGVLVVWAVLMNPYPYARRTGWCICG